MTFSEHARITFEGVLGTVGAPLERWAFTIKTQRPLLTPEAAQINALALAARDCYVGNLAPLLCTDQILTRVKHSYIEPDGTVEKRNDGSFVQGLWQGTNAGPNNPRALPAAAALCVSLDSVRAGAEGKGRFFLPFPGFPIDPADKLLSVANAQTLAAACSEFIRDLNAIGSGGVADVTIPSTKGFLSKVVSVRVGRRPDVLRSRSKSQAEQYVTSAV